MESPERREIITPSRRQVLRLGGLFGLGLGVSACASLPAPKLEVPKVTLPKVDLPKVDLKTLTPPLFQDPFALVPARADSHQIVFAERSDQGLLALDHPDVLERAEIGGLRLFGRWCQGGFAMAKTWPGAELWVNGKKVATARADGCAFIGFDRDAPLDQRFEAVLGNKSDQRRIGLRPSTAPEQSLSGLPQNQVSPSEPALLARIAVEAQKKRQAFQHQEDRAWWQAGFQWPIDAFRQSSAFGSRRILNGEPKTPHYGIDLAAPEGTAVMAPQKGRVILAEADMHFEGGLVFLDHGDGVISMYLHLSRLDVALGQIVRTGEILGAVGRTGRATGPHLCWRLKWQGQNLDPSLLVQFQLPEWTI